MKITWPKNVMFEVVELTCQEAGARGDKMCVEASHDGALLITIHDGTRIANVLVSLDDMLALGDLLKSSEKLIKERAGAEEKDE